MHTHLIFPFRRWTAPTVSRRGFRRHLAWFALLMPVAAARAQSVLPESLAARSSVIVRGRVLTVKSSQEPMVAASDRTAVISIQQMYAGREIAGDQKGRNATVILSRANAVRPGQQMVFYGSVRFLGKTMTIADIGETPTQGSDSVAASVDRGQQARANQVLRNRLAAADIVIRGAVQSVQVPDSSTSRNQRSGGRSSEHDPEWQVAIVRVATSLRGSAPDQTVRIVFAASRDIEWFNAPKLVVGEDAVILGHRATTAEQARYRTALYSRIFGPTQTYLVTKPGDVLRPADEQRVRLLLSAR